MITRRAALLFGLALLVPVSGFAETGILLLAHGGRPEWNAHVLELARRVDRTKPVEVAFGMATRRNIQAAVDRLAARGITEIVAVPLFVSSWSSVITSTEYLLGLRAEAPPALALFAKMDQPDPSAAGSGSHAAHDDAGAALGTTPVASKVPIARMTPALNDHPLVAEILASRARTISTAPAEEALVIVAHGPVSDEENQRWLDDMKVLARIVGERVPFKSIDYMTVRDDAPKPLRDAATAELRALVSKRTTEGARVLIVPLLVAFGGIEQGIVKRLEGLTYRMAGTALIPDDRLANWVLEMAAPTSR
jgi:sirohydrochlorin cobaltochelatase